PLRSSAALVAEGNLDGACGLHHLAIGLDYAKMIDRVGDWHGRDLVVLIRDHVAEFPLADHLDGVDAKPRAEDAVERGGCAAALQMAEHAGARFLAGARGNFACDDFADATELVFAVDGFVLHGLLAVFWPRAFCDDDHRAKATVFFAFADGFGDFFKIERNLRNQNDVCAAGEPAVERDLAGVATHEFDDHHATMARCGGVQAVERVGHARDG